MNESRIQLREVSKRYKIGQTGYNSLREDIVKFFKKGINDSRNYFALKDVNLQIKRKEAVGIIGPNGAGKSTILKILAGVTKPSSGTVMTVGQIGALIELFAGFHPELTGKENIYLYGSIMGMNKAYINKRYEEIVEFSGLSKFIDTPLKRYSSGMCARLGFSISAHIDPDILLVDEVLSVGDYKFQNKCVEKMEKHRASNKIIVYVSHNLDSVRKLCNRVILLNDGQIAYDGKPEEAIGMYYEKLSESQEKEKHNETLKAIEINLKNYYGKAVKSFESGEKAVFEIRLESNDDVDNAFFCMFIRHSDGQVVYDTGSKLLNGRYIYIKANQIILIRFVFDINLLNGSYTLGYSVVGSIDDKPSEIIRYKNNAVTFTVNEKSSYQGIADLRATCEIK